MGLGKTMASNRDMVRDGERMEGDPIRNLWAAVIETALEDLKRATQTFKGRESGTKEAEVRWSMNFFTSENSTLPWICTALGLDIEAIRAKARDVLREAVGR